MLPPLRQPIAVVHQIEFPIDNSPGMWIDCILVCPSVLCHGHRTIAIVPWRVAFRVPAEQIAMLIAGEVPPQFAPHVFEFWLALNGPAIREISHGVIAANRELWFVTTSHRSGEHHGNQT